MRSRLMDETRMMKQETYRVTYTLRAAGCWGSNARHRQRETGFLAMCSGAKNKHTRPIFTVLSDVCTDVTPASPFDIETTPLLSEATEAPLCPLFEPSCPLFRLHSYHLTANRRGLQGALQLTKRYSNKEVKNSTFK
ncbi:unnamed protein product [Pleuronectes platessa]|uniref:Uncharacterized protein n=1 Tax=Pleuronectes platessa TaxID=8262 RepID=A0A9N7YBT7_PLEPL|nr:unnamed protein product [Pleuronectes platessa]